MSYVSRALVDGRHDPDLLAKAELRPAPWRCCAPGLPPTTSPPAPGCAQATSVSSLPSAGTRRPASVTPRPDRAGAGHLGPAARGALSAACLGPADGVGRPAVSPGRGSTTTRTPAARPSHGRVPPGVRRHTRNRWRPGCGSWASRLPHGDNSAAADPNTPGGARSAAAPRSGGAGLDGHRSDRTPGRASGSARGAVGERVDQPCSGGRGRWRRSRDIRRHPAGDAYVTALCHFAVTRRQWNRWPARPAAAATAGFASGRAMPRPHCTCGRTTRTRRRRTRRCWVDRRRRHCVGGADPRLSGHAGPGCRRTATVRLGGRERAGLALAVDELLDDCFQVVEAGAGWDGREPSPTRSTLLVDYLRPRYRTRYTPGFFRRLCVCLVLVAAKLADPDLDAELPGTLGEELALHALVGHARLSWAVKASLGLLDAVGERYQGSPDFDDFVEAAYGTWTTSTCSTTASTGSTKARSASRWRTRPKTSTTGSRCPTVTGRHTPTWPLLDLPAGPRRASRLGPPGGQGCVPPMA